MPKKARKQATKKPKIKDLKAVKNVKGGALTLKMQDPISATGFKMGIPLSTTGHKVGL